MTVRRVGRLSYLVATVGLALVVLLLNARLYYPRGAEYGSTRLGPDVVPGLRYVGASLRGGAGERMQGLFPEGYVFAHALYGLSWVEVGLRRLPGSPSRAQALREARWALQQIDSPAGQEPFDPTLGPPFGVFYVGWSSWLRGGVLALQQASARNRVEVARFERDCAALAAAFDRGATPFLMAYSGAAWPVDSVVAVAALRLHDTLLPPRFTWTVARWLREARQRLDPATGLLPHRADPATGAPLEGARGSSQSMIARFLAEIDPSWGRAQYAQFRHLFADTVAGVPGIREYPRGVAGQGDVDSGPLLFGFSASATVVALGAAEVYGDHALADPLIHLCEAIGLPVEWGGTKRYALGQLPIGDAFLLWAKAARPMVGPPGGVALSPIAPAWWRLPLHGLSLALLALSWLPLWVRAARRVGTVTRPSST